MEYDKNLFYADIETTLSGIKDAGFYKKERIIKSAQSSNITTEKGEIICLCANNYLGLANNQTLIKCAIDTLKQGLYGMASVRFICGTQKLHKELEEKLANFLGFEDAILYSSCFDANTGLFETLLGKEDGIISDELNHASIIDGVRLCKSHKYRYLNNNMKSLEEMLIKARQEDSVKNIIIVTDGIFSMDGHIANLQGICDLAEEYGAFVVVDDSHAVGIIGEHGKGTHEYCHVMDRVDIMTGTFGKALGGASGGYIVGKKLVIDLLRQKSRPYLFSNSLAPPIVSATSKALDIVAQGHDLRKALKENTKYFRVKMKAMGFALLEGNHPIVPVMLGDATLASTMADRLLEHGVYVVGFSFPVVPMEKARIRTQMNATLQKSDIDKVLSAFEIVGKALGVIS